MSPLCSSLSFVISQPETEIQSQLRPSFSACAAPRRVRQRAPVAPYPAKAHRQEASVPSRPISSTHVKVNVDGSRSAPSEQPPPGTPASQGSNGLKDKLGVRRYGGWPEQSPSSKPRQRNVVRRDSTASLLISSINKGRFSACCFAVSSNSPHVCLKGEIVRLVPIDQTLPLEYFRCSYPLWYEVMIP
jgi:hypothetical protein